MTIPINNRMVLIIGSTTSRKTTFAIRKKYDFLLREAIKKLEELIVLDMLNIRILDGFQTMFCIKKQGYFGTITLLKMSLPSELHDEFCGRRKDSNVSFFTTEKLFSSMVNQLA